MSQERINIGGQAVIEGVMMRAPKRYVVAVRRGDKSIVVRKEDVRIDNNKMLKQPILRGLIALYDSLVLGIRALNFSAYHATGEGEEKPSTFSTVLSMVLGLGMGLVLFVWLPLQITEWMKLFYPLIEKSFVLYNTVDGVIRVIFFLLYVWIIGWFKDIRRVFEYHGAEHKVISTFEAGKELTVENARPMSRLHARCGTSFLLIVMIVSIFVFSFVPKDAPFWVKLSSRVVLVPLIAGISYEILKFSGRHQQNRFVRFISAPGLWIQRLTTREPDDSQIEVAIISMKEALDMQEEGREDILYV